ncbi:hypothetical protein [Burkholderia cepacia]|uniref:hypothetical protein n=1 Tax=Burkholderia cepacia TaxID=292 RepID=UPI00398ECCF3
MLFIPFSGPTALTKDALLLFLGTDSPTWHEIKEKFKEWADDNVISPELLILATVDTARTLREASERENDSRDSIEIISRLCHIRLLSFDGNGYISHVEKKSEDRISVNGTPDILLPAIDSFIKTELETGNVVTAAPPGFYFSKLSTRYSSHFIRTESLLHSTEAIELLALRLLEPFRSYCDSLEDGKVRILIDSMSIWPLAQALAAMRRDKDPKRRYIVESFRSYEGLSKDSIKSGPAFIIISASTSGGLERRLRDILGTNHVTCNTILGLEPDASKISEATNNKNNYLFVIPRTLSGPSALEGLREHFDTEIAQIPPGCESVEIIGERFLNQNFRPKGARLAHAALDDGKKGQLANLAQSNIALAARRRPDDKTYWSLSFNVTSLVDRYCIDDEIGECLLRSWLANYAVAGNAVVVYPVDTLESGRPDEGESKRMAERVQKILTDTSPSATIQIVTSYQLDSPTPDLSAFIRNAGVVITAPIIGNGFIFKQISAALRAIQPKGPRLYLSLAVLPESQARLQELRGDLQSNADDSAYHFKCAIALPTGKLDQDIDWYKESRILAGVIDTCVEEDIEVPSRLEDRQEKFRAGNGLPGELAFLPSYRGNALAMSPGFLLWKTKTPIAGNDLGASVLMTVAAFLEACRTGAAKNSETSLVSGLFQQTLIAPANFTRFNDPAIQAALLRAAYQPELNFASSRDMSSDMQRLILRLIRLHDAPAGEALPEFLLALALKRLTLHREHMSEVRDEALKLPGWIGILAKEIN